MSIEKDVSRVEKKYILSYRQAEQLFLKLKQVLPGDEINGYEAYMVRSLYFDSYHNDDYFDKLAGIKNRKKIRIRIYDFEDGKAKLELKQKDGENQRKRSLTISRQEAEMMSRGDYEFLLKREEKIAEDIYYIMLKETYRPKCIVEYKRRAFAIPTNNIRITLDSEIMTSEGNLDLYSKSKAMLLPVESKNTVILEVKYNHFLLIYIKDLLQVCDVPQESYSKYTTGRYYGLS